jgi:predicted molibdopterin-dependent oxidoreductase YjgC
MPGFEELRASLDDVVMGVLPQVCGIEPDAIAEAAALLAEKKPCVVMFGLGVLQQQDSTLLVKALVDVALLLGGSVMPLRGQNNAQGACDMGVLRGYLPGYQPIDSAEALLVFGENVALSAPNTERTLSALENLDFLAVSDLYLTETAQLADVVFPACSFLEKDGTFTSIGRRVQRVRKMIDPVGQSKSDLEIIAGLASAFGKQITADPAAVMAEIAANVPMYAHCSYEQFETGWGEPWRAEAATSRLAPIPATDLQPEDPDYP